MTLSRRGGSDLEWSVEMEFHQSILIWHLATEICYRIDYVSEPKPDNISSIFHDRGNCMSRYMLYLLVEHPNMLPIGMGQIKFRDLYSDLADFMEMYISKPLKDVTEKEASKMLMEIVNPNNMLVGGGDRSNFVILHGCKLASQLRKFEQVHKWDIIVHVWMEMLGHAASQCKGRHHAQQLRRGGEYLTHLWLLMAHFGYTDNFQILRSRQIAGAVLRIAMKHDNMFSYMVYHSNNMERMYLEKVQQLVFFSIVMLAFKISHVKIILSVVGSVILISRRQSSELYPTSWRNLWKEWQLQGLVLLSLTAQIVLVIFGNRRKYIAKTWIQAIVWSAYLLADSVATMAIGILSNNVAEVYWNDNRHAFALDYELMAFWAPFLLLHMGGMDTITAFSLEDNELWMRHFFTVIIQAVTTVYILLMSWSTSSHLSPLYIVVFFVGLVKYCERVWALFSASEKRFRDSIPEMPTSESKIMEACKLKQLEGYHVTAHQVLEVEVPVFDDSVPDCDDAIEILLAHSFLEMVKRLFADLILGFQDRDASRAIFESNNMDHHKALKVIEIELGLIYDVMYTKAMIVYSSWGIAGRIIGRLT
ncbi:hypothetical protein RHGRI_025926 [Rhododendron griersonianum]|uniref:DUF4220 domain-containing protein n=1 Tax=Rhododendron griersonianum TaxID=479676 RepID=A0AAV6IVD8_9ERIC|nr:hypothetical protein RHGRI_025926 [Rhododendron griersonianum]